jgi:hypothetical protein
MLRHGSIAVLLAVTAACAAEDDLEGLPDDDQINAVDLTDMETTYLAAVTEAAGAVLYVPPATTNLRLSRDEAEGALAIEVLATGDPLPGTDPAEFAEAKTAFEASEEIDEGLGPIFNEDGCVQCHSIGASGGSGLNIERRFGLFANGTFNTLAAQGGSLRDLFSNGTYVFNGVTCNIPVEATPGNANVVERGRRSLPLFGLGLFDSLPDAVFGQVQATQPADRRGLARQVTTLFPDVRDPAQRVGGTRLARFGWKLGVPSLVQFSADAYMNEMGITTQSCVRGVSITAFANEQFPNNVAPPANCNGGDLAPANPPGNPAIPQFTDDVVGNCADAALRNTVQDDVELFRTFMEHLAPVPRDFSAGTTLINQGEQVFAAIGCAGCHVNGTYITPTSPFNGVPGRAQFQLFSDMMLHDMGAAADGIGQNDGDDAFRTRLIRTPILRGLRLEQSFMHDGRATTIDGAINAHGGTPATQAAANFRALSSSNRTRILAFLNSL